MRNWKRHEVKEKSLFSWSKLNDVAKLMLDRCFQKLSLRWTETLDNLDTRKKQFKKLVFESFLFWADEETSLRSWTYLEIKRFCLSFSYHKENSSENLENSEFFQDLRTGSRSSVKNTLSLATNCSKNGWTVVRCNKQIGAGCKPWHYTIILFKTFSFFL